MKIPQHASYDRERNTEIIRLYKSGVPTTQLSKRFNLSRQRIHQVLQRVGVSANEGGLKKRLEAARDTVAQRLEEYPFTTNTELAQVVDVSPSTIGSIRTALGVPPSYERTPEEEYYRYVCPGQAPEECWGWNGTINKASGNPYMAVNYSQYLARRVAWAVHFPDIPVPVRIRTSCKNKLCTNPLHLYDAQSQ
jgi:hypothetical protein